MSGGDHAVVALDLGGSKIAAARVASGQVLARRQVATPRSGRFEDLLEAMAGLVADWTGDRWTSAPRAGGFWPGGVIGLAATGLVEAGRLTAINPETLAIPGGQPIEAALGARLGARVLAVNDAQAAAWGEFRYGAGRGARSMLFVTVSTGVGGGLVLEGRLQRGLAGHIGHVVAAPDGPPCGCGRRGCLETVASGRALTIAATRRFGHVMTAEALFAAATADAAAAALLDHAAAAIARALADLRATLDIDRAVIGGGVGLAPGFLGRVAAALSRDPARFRPSLGAAELGHDAGLIGAAELARISA